MNLAAATDDELLELLHALEDHAATLKYTHYLDMYPEDGPLGWREYTKHFAFWEMGKTESERALISANRCGKTIAGGYETMVHLTGLYPSWWPGVHFDGPVKGWAAGDTADTVRDIIQPVLFGDRGDWGSGLIPKHLIVDVLPRRGGGGGIDTAWIRRDDAPDKPPSVLQLKSYEQGRKTFQGTAMHLIWLDEEPDMQIYSECQIRTMSTEVGRQPGQLICTFTPLLGMSDTVLHFLPGGRMP